MSALFIVGGMAAGWGLAWLYGWWTRRLYRRALLPFYELSDRVGPGGVLTVALLGEAIGRVEERCRLVRADLTSR